VRDLYFNAKAAAIPKGAASKASGGRYSVNSHRMAMQHGGGPYGGDNVGSRGRSGVNPLSQDSSMFSVGHSGYGGGNSAANNGG
jgi:hypothetical protein